MEGETEFSNALTHTVTVRLLPLGGCDILYLFYFFWSNECWGRASGYARFIYIMHPFSSNIIFFQHSLYLQKNNSAFALLKALTYAKLVASDFLSNIQQVQHLFDQ